LQIAVALRQRGLLLQLAALLIELGQDVLHPAQVGARIEQPRGGLAAALFVFGHPGRFLQKQAQVFGAALDDAADGALANDGVGARPQPGAQEQIVHVAPAHRLLVDVVAAGAIACEHPAHRQLGITAPRPGHALAGVVKHQLDAGAAGGLAQRAAIEDHVLHRLAAQLAGLALAQHPAHGVHDVGFAATVGADHPHQLARQAKGGGFGKGLEARQLDGL